MDENDVRQMFENFKKIVKADELNSEIRDEGMRLMQTMTHLTSTPITSDEQRQQILSALRDAQVRLDALEDRFSDP